MSGMETWFGAVRSLYDAILIIEGARTGALPRLTRRLKEDERANIIQSGSVFVFEEGESQIRRWADSKTWSSSRVRGHFLVYHSVEPGQDYPPNRNSGSPEPNSPESNALRKSGLSVSTIHGQKMRLIAYFTQADMDRLPTVDQEPRLANVQIPDGFYFAGNEPISFGRTSTSELGASGSVSHHPAVIGSMSPSSSGLLSPGYPGSYPSTNPLPLGAQSSSSIQYHRPMSSAEFHAPIPSPHTASGDIFSSGARPSSGEYFPGPGSRPVSTEFLSTQRPPSWEQHSASAAPVVSSSPPTRTTSRSWAPLPYHSQHQPRHRPTSMDYSPHSPSIRDHFPSSEYQAVHSPRGSPPSILSPSAEMGPSSQSGTPQQAAVILPYIPAEERTPRGDSQSPAEARYKRLSGEDGRQLRALDEVFRLD